VLEEARPDLATPDVYVEVMRRTASEFGKMPEASWFRARVKKAKRQGNDGTRSLVVALEVDGLVEVNQADALEQDGVLRTDVRAIDGPAAIIVFGVRPGVGVRSQLLRHGVLVEKHAPLPTRVRRALARVFPYQSVVTNMGAFHVGPG
jgi:hypothetical protein